MAATAHLAAVEWRMAGHFTGAPFMDLEPTGRRIDIRGLDLLEIEDGEIVGNTAYYDGASFARQVGMLPSEGSGAERAMKGAFNAVTKMRRSGWADMSVLVALTVGLVWWITAWAFGIKAFDAFLLTAAMVVVAAAAHMVKPFVDQVLRAPSRAPPSRARRRAF